jgi:hypothetical protein
MLYRTMCLSAALAGARAALRTIGTLSGRRHFSRLSFNLGERGPNKFAIHLFLPPKIKTG